MVDTYDPQTEHDGMTTVRATAFMVDKEAHCVWDDDMYQRNREFLDTIDTGYYDYVAKLHTTEIFASEQSEGEETAQGKDEAKERNKQYAATNLRNAYSHGLETLFALVCSAVQAPNCVIGWMSTYQNKDLKEVVRKIHNHEFVANNLPLKQINWHTLAKALNVVDTGDEERDKRIIAQFEELLERFAEEFLDKLAYEEYNAFKHALRSRPGPSYFAVGVEDTPGIPASQMHVLWESEFGSTYYKADPIKTGERIVDGKVEEVFDRRNLHVRHQRLNWHPQKYTVACQLLALLISNVVATLKYWNGADPATFKWEWPSDEAMFDAPWSNQLAKSQNSFRFIAAECFAQPQVKLLTKPQLEMLYEQDKVPWTIRNEQADGSDQGEGATQDAGTQAGSEC